MLLLHRGEVVGLDRRTELGNLALDLLLGVLGDLIPELLELLLGLVAHRVGGVLGVDGVALRLVSLGVGLSVLHHPLDLVLGEGGGAGDLDVRRLAGTLVNRGDGEDAVGVNVKLHLNLGHTAGRGGDAVEAEVAEGLVVLDELALALEDVDLDRGLAIRGGGEHLRLGGGEGGVAHDELGHHAAEGLETEGERGDIEKDDVGHLAAEDTRLDSRAERDNLVGVDGHVGLLTGELLDEGANRGDAGGAADEDHLVHVVEGELGVAEGVLDGHLASGDEVVAELLKLGAGEVGVDVLGAVGGGGDEGEGDGGVGGGGELHLGLLGSLGETLQRLLVLHEVHALSLLEVGGEPLDDALVKVVAAEEGVTRGGEHLEDAVANLEDGDVEGTAAEVEDEDGLVGLLLEAVGEGRGGGLVDDAEHLDAGNLTGILGRLALGVVEVGGDGDDRLGDGVAEVGGGVVAELAEDLRGDLLGGEVLAGDGGLDLHVAGVALDHGVGHLAVLLANLVPAAADEALDGEEGVLGVDHALTLGDLWGKSGGIERQRRARVLEFTSSERAEKKPPSTAVGAGKWITDRGVRANGPGRRGGRRSWRRRRRRGWCGHPRSWSRWWESHPPWRRPARIGEETRRSEFVGRVEQVSAAAEGAPN